VALQWRRYPSFQRAFDEAGDESSLYTLQNPDRTALYVGQTRSLRQRYASVRGAMDALMSASHALLFVAPVDPALADLVEHTIVFWDCTPHNARLHASMPSPVVAVRHYFEGSAPGTYDGPQFCPPGTMRDADSGRYR